MSLKRSYLLLWLSTFLLYISNGISIAPADFDAECIGLVTRIPVSPNEKVLLDTQDYQSQNLIGSEGQNNKWKSVDFDGVDMGGTYNKWVDLVQGIVCRHGFLACDYMNQPQKNWLITQYINISDDGVDELTIDMTFFSVTQCACQQSFSVWAYETNVIDETGRVNDTFYRDTGVRLFHTTDQGEQTTASQRFTISSRGMYLSVVDGGSCTRISRILVYYNVCPYQVVNMVVYPETVAPPFSKPQDRVVTGTCVNNSSPISGNLDQLECEVSGVWGDSQVMCSCNAGYENISGICEACMEGEYKSLQGVDDKCIVCPENSNSTDVGALRCECLDGYYRAENEGVDTDCTAPPSAPRNLLTTNIQGTFISINWTGPSMTGERTDISYNITYSNGSFNSLVYSVSDTQYTLTGLIPQTTYTISVISINGVSEQDPDVESRTVSIDVTTDISVPTSPLDIELSSSGEGIASILSWAEPASLFGIFQHYNIRVADVDVSNQSTIEDTTNETMYDLSDLDISAGTYYVWVQAVTDIGEGELSTSVKYVRVMEDEPIESSNILSLFAIIGIVVGVVLFLVCVIIIVTVVIIVLMVCINRKEKGGNYSVNSTQSHFTPNHSGEMELRVIDNDNARHRMYVDPRNYSSLNQAIEQTGVKEIPPKEITNLDEIGVGEFGLVYKAQWSLKNVSVAVKTLRGGATESQKQNFLFEASVMGQFRHPNVVKLYGVISRVDPVMIVMEYLENGSLDRYLQKHLDKLGLVSQLNIAYGVACGMSYLSGIGFVHRDLATRNILLTKEKVPKVADFGLARELVENEYGVQKGGRIPVRWTAPEAISHRSFTTASDVWSFGVTLWEIMTYGETPYEGWDNYAVFQRLESGERLQQPKDCPDDVFQLMCNCWDANRSERPSFDQICENLEILINGKPRPKPKPKHLQKSPPPPPPTSQSNPLTTAQGITMEELLRSIGMSRYVDLFHEHNLIMVTDCFDMTEDDLEKMGITLGGHQYKIVKNIHIKQEELGTQSPF